MAGRARIKRVVAIDWDARTLRIVHAFLGKRGVKIERLLCVAIPSGVDPASPELMGRHIRRTLDQEGISTKNAIVDIPRDQAILKTLMLPVGQPDELPGMVEIQIAKELPFPVNEAVIDFAVGTAAEGEVTGEVLVAAIRCEVLEQYEATFASAGLKLARIGLRPYANKVSVCELLKHAMPERVLFIDVRPTFMEIDVLRQSALVFSRSASVMIPKEFQESSIFSISRSEAPGGTEAGSVGRESGPAAIAVDEVVHSLVLEVTRSIEAYRAGDPGASIDHVVIGGAVGVEEALGEAIAKQLDLTTESYNPASTFGWEPDEGAEASAFAASLGLVLGHAHDGTLHFDFLHPKKTVSVTQQRLKKAPLAAAVVVLFVAAGSVGFAEYTKADRDRLDRLDRYVRALRVNRSANEKFLDVAERARAFDADQLVWVDVMYDVFALLPSNKEMAVRHFETNHKDGRLTLKTRAKHRETATELIRELEAFRRAGRDKPRFRVSMGPQTEKKHERYPFAQDLRIWVLDDEPDRKRASQRSARG